MKIDQDKVDELVLALLGLWSGQEHTYHRAWKSIDWDVMGRLHERGYISDPVGKAKSIVITDEGYKKAQELIRKYFEINEDEQRP